MKLKKLKEHAVIIDIGANIGMATAYFKNKFPLVKIIAIEASPINYELLVNNIETNHFQNITAMNNFISDKSEQIKFYHDISKPGGSFGENYRIKRASILKEFDVESKRLKDIISGLNNIVIKIDVEGAEYDILRDLATSLSISEFLEITVEVSTYNLNDYQDLNRILTIYYNLGFEARFISDYTISSLMAKTFHGHLQLNLTRS